LRTRVWTPQRPLPPPNPPPEAPGKSTREGGPPPRPRLPFPSSSVRAGASFERRLPATPARGGWFHKGAACAAQSLILRREQSEPRGMRLGATPASRSHDPQCLLERPSRAASRPPQDEGVGSTKEPLAPPNPSS